MNNVLAVVIARSGSKGIPGKNLKKIGGIPLAAFKIISALKCRGVNRVILSTDSPEIQEVGRSFGAEVPFLRPSELATDTASSDDVALHAMEWVEGEGGPRPDAVLLLEPATPFATDLDYQCAIDLMSRENAKMVVGMAEHKINRVFIGEMDERGSIGSIVKQMDQMKRLDRQSLPSNYTMNGAFYLLNWDHFKSVRRRYTSMESSFGIVMDEYHSIELDLPIDLRWVEFLVEQGLIDLAPWRKH